MLEVTVFAGGGFFYRDGAIHSICIPPNGHGCRCCSPIPRRRPRRSHFCKSMQSRTLSAIMIANSVPKSGVVVPRPTPARVKAAARSIGQQLAAWRKLQSLTAAQVAERADVARSTLSKIEAGDSGVGFESVLKVARALGVLDALVVATDPYETDLGRARADEALPQRVRR